MAMTWVGKGNRWGDEQFPEEAAAKVRQPRLELGKWVEPSLCICRRLFFLLEEEVGTE